MDSNNEENPLKGDPAADITEKFKEIILSNGITDAVSEVIVKDAGLQGQGFASVTQLVTVKFEDAEVKPLNLFVKGHTQKASHTDMLEEMKAFEKESTFLKKYVPAAKEMCKRKGHEGFIDFYPKCYHGDKKMIVLENLVLDKGYEMVSMDVRQDLETARCAIETLAKQHAIGHVMIQEYGGAPQFFEQFPNLDFETYDKPHFGAMMESSFDMSINANAKILERSGLFGAERAAARLKEFLGKRLSLVLDEIFKETDEKLVTFSHGDFWNNNMMFLKDKETNEIMHCVAIDFQITRYNSAALDLSYYLFLSVQTKVRRDNMKELLELYLSTFNKITTDFGHPVDLTYDRLFLEYRRKFGYGYWIGFTNMGPVIEMYQSIDISTTDLSDFADIAGGMLDKWIDDNPDKLPELAEELIAWVHEYDELVVMEGNK